MKKIITSLLFATLATSALADRCCYRPHYNYYVQPAGGWIAPALIGGVIGYELAQPKTVIVEPQPIVVQGTAPAIQLPPPGYHWVEMFDQQTNTKRIVLVPNQ